MNAQAKTLTMVGRNRSGSKKRFVVEKGVMAQQVLASESFANDLGHDEDVVDPNLAALEAMSQPMDMTFSYDDGEAEQPAFESHTEAMPVLDGPKHDKRYRGTGLYGRNRRRDR
ncbi:hypothetical protein [Neptuniibacter sp. QD37_11]|uniref:hypothetical protein n=1 Tax=Neptuniibacter sp. QD37_11 TaxID=3398209 RepID=UPI0039F47507